MGIVATLKDSLLIIRTILSPELANSSPEQKERFETLVGYVQNDSKWSVTRLCTMNNYNRTYLGIQNSMEMSGMTNQILDPSFKQIAENSYPCAVDEASAPYLIKQGVLLLNGSYKSGKTKLIPQIISGFQEVASIIEKAEQEKQRRMKNLPTFSIQ